MTPVQISQRCNMAEINAAETVTSVLLANGVDRIYSLAGESFLHVLDAVRDDGKIDVVTVHHEGSGGLMAVADARLTGKIAVAAVSRGPGATNAAIALHTARDDAVPLLLLVGQVERAYLRREGFQELNYANMFGDVAKWTVEITDPQRAAEMVSTAIHYAYSGTPGPVVVVMPEDVMSHAVHDVIIPPPFKRPLTAPQPDALRRIATMIRNAERPLLICGGEISERGGREALFALACSAEIPVAVTFRRHDLFPNKHPLFAGDLGLQTTVEQWQAFEDSDLIIAVGTRLQDLSTSGYTFPRAPKPAQSFVHVYEDPGVIGRHYSPDIGISCNATVFMRALRDELNGFACNDSRQSWVNRLQALRKAMSEWQPVEAHDGIVFGNMISALEHHLEPNAIVVLDAGMAAALAYRYISWTPPQLLLAPITGSMGFGISGAIAAALRNPDRQVIMIAGDGGFLMSVAELALVVERRLPIRFIIANNKSYGVIRLHQEKLFGPERHIGTNLSTPDFVKLGEAFGIPSAYVDIEEHKDIALKKLLSGSGPALLEVGTSLYAQLPAQD